MGPCVNHLLIYLFTNTTVSPNAIGEVLWVGDILLETLQVVNIDDGRQVNGNLARYV